MKSIPLYLKIIICVILCISLGVVSGFVGGSPLSSWYQALNKPFFQPPSWIFGPAWTLLYSLMGIAAALIWDINPDSSRKTKALRLFILQFLVNMIWSPVFFGLQMPSFALVVIVLLWALILSTIIQFMRLHKIAGYLLLPYLAWVSFATILNAAIVYLN